MEFKIRLIFERTRKGGNNSKRLEKDFECGECFITVMCCNQRAMIHRETCCCWTLAPLSSAFVLTPLPSCLHAQPRLNEVQSIIDITKIKQILLVSTWLISIENWAGKQNEMHAYVFVCDVVVCIPIFYRNVLIYFIQKKMDWWGKEVQNLQNGLKQSASKQKTEYIYLRRYNKNQTHKFTYFPPFDSQQFLNSLSAGNCATFKLPFSFLSGELTKKVSRKIGAAQENWKLRLFVSMA